MTATAPSSPPPVVRLVRGLADDDEIAAVVAVLQALAARAAAPAPRTARRAPAPWTRRADPLGAGAWRAEPPERPALRRSAEPGAGR